MKVCVFAAGLLLLAGCALAGDFDGKWSGKWSGYGKMQRPGPSTEPATLTYTFKSEGDKLTGSVMSSQDNKENPIKDGKIDGKNISFTYDVDILATTLKFKCKGVLSGEEIKLTWDMEMNDSIQKGEVTAKKVK